MTAIFNLFLDDCEPSPNLLIYIIPVVIVIVIIIIAIVAVVGWKIITVLAVS